MLIKAIVDNFLSFEKETELTMIPSNKTRMTPEHKIGIKGTSLLKYAVIYGANASGKSNLIEVFRFIQYCVKKAIPMEAASKFCKTREENIDRPSTFELQFTIHDKFYAYGFSLLLKDRSVTAEWLYELYQNGSQKTLFERVGGKKPTIGAELNLSAADRARLTTYISDFEEDSNALFLTVMNRGKRYAYGSKLGFFADVYQWIARNLTIVTPKTSLRSFEYYDDDISLSHISNLIKTFDTGITQINIANISLEEMRQELPERVFDDILSTIRARAESEEDPSFNLTMRSESCYFHIVCEKGKEPEVSTISLKHGKSFYDFKYREESDGTRRLFDLIDMLLSRSEHTVYLVDEMERSLHPKLLSKFIELFGQAHADQKTQLIFTTHESSIMDQNMFRRDEIWFVERDRENISHIYSLDKFKERYDRKLSKAYLEGRYGAIPVFTSFRFREE